MNEIVGDPWAAPSTPQRTATPHPDDAFPMAGRIPKPAANWASTMGIDLPDVLASAMEGQAAPGGDSLAALRERAREAREQLGRQPLPITNHNSRLILKLFGG